MSEQVTAVRHGGRGLFLAFALALVVPLAGAEADTFAPAVQPLLEKYCYKCHDDETQKGDLDLSGYASTAQVIGDRKIWLHVLEQLETREMPTKKPLPTEAEYEAMIEWVDAAVNDIDWSQYRSAGHVTIPRLTKREYGNTMRELLGIELDIASRFSADGEGQSGFDNDRDALFVTPALLEKYFEAAELGINALTAHREAEQTTELFFEAEEMFMTETGSRPAEWGKDRGYVLNRGQQTLYESVEFPVDGFYEFTVRSLTTDGPSGARLRIDDVPHGDLEVASRTLSENRLLAFVEAGSRQMAWNIQKPLFRKGDSGSGRGAAAADELPANASELVTANSRKHAPRWETQVGDAPGADPEAIAKIITRLNANAVNVQRAWEWLHLHGPDGAPRELRRFLTYIDDRGAGLEKASNDLAEALGMTREQLDLEFEKRNVDRLKRNTDLLAAIRKVMKAAPLDPPGLVGIDWVRVRGPVPPPRLGGGGKSEPEGERVFISMPGDDASEDDAAKSVLANFLERAFRRPVADAEVDRYLVVYRESRAGKEGNHLQGLKLALSAALVSPNFLFRHELDSRIGDGEMDGADDYALNDWQLASRLSYFIWQSMPDEELFELARAGELNQPEVLRGQVERMLADPRGDEFAGLFVGQWLGYGPQGENLFPDERKFRREWSPELRAAMVAETALFFEALIDEGHSLLQLVDSRETFLNETLAKHYRIDGVLGSEMRRVALPDHRRGGVLGMGSVLTATSTPTRTSPVVRGAFLLEKILAETVPPPPPNAGELPDDAGEAKGKRTLREELEVHRDNADCAACHAKIDPLGFGLEHFDAIGRWRANSASGPIDARGTLPTGESFDGVAELKRFILRDRRDGFLRGVSEAMLKFALGRELDGFDEPAVTEILDELKTSNYDASVLIEAIVMSYPFRNQASGDEH